MKTFHGFQFTLQRLLILIAVVSAGLAWIAAERVKTRRQQEAIAFLESREIGLTNHDSRQSGVWKWLVGARKGDRVRHVMFDTATHNDLRQLAYLPNVTTVSMDACAEDSDLTALRAAPSLSKLIFISSALRDNGLKFVGEIRQLKILYLDGTAITDAGLNHLRGLQLKELSLSSTDISDNGIAALETMRSLESLNLGDTRVTNAGLKRLHGLTSLKEVNAGGTQVTDAGVRALREAIPGIVVER